MEGGEGRKRVTEQDLGLQVRSAVPGRYGGIDPWKERCASVNITHYTSRLSCWLVNSRSHSIGE